MQTADIVQDAGVDLTELFARVEYDRELLQDVVQIFAEEFPKLHHMLKDAMLRGDGKQIQTSAHTLKGMLASLSFGKASASAMRIERMARHSDLQGIPEEVARLEQDTTFAQAHLEKACAQVVW